jgi:hypothetical protein
MKRLLDIYFRRPILSDLVLAFAAVLSAKYLVQASVLFIPPTERLYSTVSDVCTVSLTMAGFILTLLTVLISFKSTSRVDPENIKMSDKVFDIFFISPLYFQTVKILQNAILSLTSMALIGYLLKILFNSPEMPILFFYCIFSVTIVMLTILRSVIILSSIIKMQSNHNQQT